jgi:hypothetical protein
MPRSTHISLQPLQGGWRLHGDGANVYPDRRNRELSRGVHGAWFLSDPSAGSIFRLAVF